GRHRRELVRAPRRRGRRQGRLRSGLTGRREARASTLVGLLRPDSDVGSGGVDGVPELIGLLLEGRIELGLGRRALALEVENRAELRLVALIPGLHRQAFLHRRLGLVPLLRFGIDTADPLVVVLARFLGGGLLEERLSLLLVARKVVAPSDRDVRQGVIARLARGDLQKRLRRRLRLLAVIGSRICLYRAAFRENPTDGNADAEKNERYEAAESCSHVSSPRRINRICSLPPNARFAGWWKPRGIASAGMPSS